MPSYDFKAAEECGWFVAVAVLTTLMEALVRFDPEQIVDGRAWAVALFAACVRAGAGATLAYLARRRLDGPADATAGG